VALTPEKETHWRKWIGIYNEKMLSKGTFRNLYNYGHDVPEGYAIEKDGMMYYAFFAPTSTPWKGEGATPVLANSRADYSDNR
jgi:alpha-galactosidase